MSRQAQLVVALAGLWGGAFAWNRAAMPRQERVARLTHTGNPVAESAGDALVWPDRSPPSREERRVSRDLFRRAPDRPAPAPSLEPAATPAPEPPALRYVGFVADGSGRKVLLSGEGGVRVAGEGDMLPGGWRLERIESDRLTLRETSSGVETSLARER